MDSSTSPSVPARLPAGRRFLFAFLTLSFGLLLALALLEVCLQIYNPFFARIKGNRIVLQANKRIQFTNRIIQGLEETIVVTRNSLGFRGPEPPGDFASRLTLMTVGGSTTQCFMVSDDKTWTAVLAQSLSPQFPRLWVNNAGLDGHSTFGHLVLVEDHIRKIRPKVILFLVGANDVARSRANAFDAENVRGEVRWTDVRGLVKSLSAYSEVISLGLNFYRSLSAYQAGLLDQNMDFSKLGTRPMTEAEQEKLLGEQVQPEQLDGFRQRLERLVALTRAGGSEPMLITQPLLWGKGVDEVTGVDLEKVKLGVGNGTTALRIQEKYNDVTRGVCQARGVTCLDIAGDVPKTRRNFYDNVHYTVEGNRAVAAAVYRRLCPALREKYPAFQAGPCS